MISVVPHWLELFVFAALFVIGLFRAAASVLEALHELLNNESQEKIRERVVGFWVKTAELEFAKKLQIALRSRYMRMGVIRHNYLRLFGFILVLLLVIGGYDLISTNDAEQIEIAKNTITADFDARAQYLRSNAFSDAVQNTQSRDKDCITRKAYDPYEFINALAALDGLKRRVFEEIDYLSVRPVKLWLSGFTTQAVSLLFLAIPLFIALRLSFNMTLWILSKVTESKVRLVLIGVFDIIIALMMPPILASAMLLSVFLIMVFRIGNVIDFTTFPNPNWMTIGISTASVLLHAMYIVPLGFAYILFLLPGIASIFLAPIAITVVLYMAYGNLHAFIFDTGKFFSLDFNESVQQALINYAIAIDLLFSFTYLLPCIALVTAHRSERTRRAFLSITQWIAENPNGVLPAIAKILRGIADVIAQFFRRQKD